MVKGSNKASGGGANALVKHVTTRKSRMGIAAQYLDDLLQPEDEQLYIGDGNLFVFLYRFLPQVSMIGTYLRYIIIFSIFFVHNTLYANASWYAPVVLKLMRFRHHIRGQLPDPKQPALWVCNHFSYTCLCTRLGVATNKSLNSSNLTTRTAALSLTLSLWARNQIAQLNVVA